MEILHLLFVFVFVFFWLSFSQFLWLHVNEVLHESEHTILMWYIKHETMSHI